jgi:hypothetical protein
MAPLPTASRIFAEQYFRELRRREAMHATALAPGAKDWTDAVLDAFERIHKLGNPIKRVAAVRKIVKHLNDHVTPEHCAHFMLDYAGGTRSVWLDFATLSAGDHPLEGVTETGVNISQHRIICRRPGSCAVMADMNLAYISKHAIGRMHERGVKLTVGTTTGALAFIGVLGLLMRDSEKHWDAGLCLRFGEALVVGSTKRAMKQVDEGRAVARCILDVRTALLTEDVKDQRMVEQGNAAANAVMQWLDGDRHPKHARELAEAIPSLPRRDDYSTQQAYTHAAAKQQSKEQL